MGVELLGAATAHQPDRNLGVTAARAMITLRQRQQSDNLPLAQRLGVDDVAMSLTGLPTLARQLDRHQIDRGPGVPVPMLARRRLEFILIGWVTWTAMSLLHHLALRLTKVDATPPRVEFRLDRRRRMTGSEAAGDSWLALTTRCKQGRRPRMDVEICVRTSHARCSVTLMCKSWLVVRNHPPHHRSRDSGSMRQRDLPTGITTRTAAIKSAGEITAKTVSTARDAAAAVNVMERMAVTTETGDPGQ